MAALVSGAGLLAALVIFAISAAWMARHDVQSRMLTLADVVASHGRDAIVTNNSAAATATLMAFKADPQIVAAVVLNAEGRVLAEFWGSLAEPGNSADWALSQTQPSMIATRIGIRRAIEGDGRLIGEVHVVADLADTWRTLFERVAAIAAITAVIYWLSLFLAARYRRAIVQPIERLAVAADRVSASRQYARVEKESDDEIGALVDAFNRMLAQIETRDRQLESARQDLEARVAERTAELQASNGRLESEVKERRAAEFAAHEAKEAAEAANRTKSQFLANMSHEIRTPMNGVLGMIELLLGTELSARQRHYAETVQRSGETLLEIINEILDYSKVEAGRMDIEAAEFEPQQALIEVVTLLSDRASRKGLVLTKRVDPDVPQAVVGDQRRIKQILMNLIGNAIKFTDRGDVQASLRVAHQEGSAVSLQFEVRDSGIGIAPDALARIFEPFSQADGSMARRHGGTGLGLAIAKQLAQLMGGEIGVDSAIGRGSTFWFTVRVPRMQSSAAPVASRPPAEPARPTRFCGRVLVAEDNPVNRELAVAMLEATGVEPIVAHDGREAVDAAMQGSIDLILMDCQMPELDGFAATRKIRESQPQDAWRVPIVAVTANAMDGDRERCLAAGMDDYLSKPFKPAQLYAVLARWLPPAAAVVAQEPSGVQAAEQWALKTLEFNAIDQIRSVGGADADRLLDNIVRLYCDSVPQMLTSMHEAAAKGDCVALQRAAHALKSSSHNVGAIRLANLCRDLEQAAHGGTVRFDRMNALEFEFNSVRRALQRVA